MPGGRPRTFDETQALDRAVEVFWRHGYEGTSLADLTAAMGVNKPSLYAVFGSKEELLHRAVQRYAERDMAYVRTALAEPTAYRVTQTFLLQNASAVTRRDRPAGCLTIQGGLSCGTDNSAICAYLAASRRAGERALADRFRAALAEGDLPPDADADALARYVSTVSEGQAVHAAAGATLAELQQTVDIALRSFPTGPTTRLGTDPA